MEEFNKVSEIVDIAEKEGCKISDVVLRSQANDMDVSIDVIKENMAKSLTIMKEAVEKGMNPRLKSTSGLTGGDAYKVGEYAKNAKNLVGPSFTNALSKAIAVSEYNACMGRIVAAPTAGSCGILPSVLLSVQETLGVSDDDLVKAMFTAAGLGIIIAKNASIAGAEGGCQAECGSASAMAAAAAVELAGGSPTMSAHACAIAMKNSMGLVCDPVAGLVEVPCVKRNAGAVANAFAAAEMALAGVKSVIPVDEVIIAMKNVGLSMSHTLKETGLGGIAGTPTAIEITKNIFG